MSLVPFEYAGAKTAELIEIDGEGEANVPNEVVDEEWLAATPAEYLVVQRLKERSGVQQQFWFNGQLDDIRVCRVCGGLFRQEDWEDSVLEIEACPICHAAQPDRAAAEGGGGDEGTQRDSDILAMLRSFADDSPVPF